MQIQQFVDVHPIQRLRVADENAVFSALHSDEWRCRIVRKLLRLAVPRQLIFGRGIFGIGPTKTG
jgi:hypothetical protein